ncbi:MAG: fibronectin type III domain-containing protein [Planctomycetia bacterium]|nr:MAG: fibronectin type III domain-containing protein [Planctomycetia bacterium]
MDRRSSLRPVAVLERSSTWPMPSGDTILDAQDVEAHVLANAGCRLPILQPALDDYDQALRAAQLITGNSPSNVVFPDNLPTNDGNPGTPILLSPANQATGVSTTVTLTWDESDETDDYVVYIGASTPLTNPTATTTNTQWQATGLQANTLYHWRVVARDSCENTAGSEVRSFTTE